MHHKMTRVTEVSNFDERYITVGEEWKNVSKNDVGYGKIAIMYEGRQFLLRIPKCKTMGVQSTEMDNGYIRRTMPLVFENPLTDQQEKFKNAFENITRNVYEQLISKGYLDSKLSKLGSCLWRSMIFYASIVESVYDCSNNTRYFINDEEVNRETVGEGIEYDANAAVLIDSIYVGERTVSIQAKLYEVSLTPSKKRARVL